jgi:hypothetical protein
MLIQLLYRLQTGIIPCIIIANKLQLLLISIEEIIITPFRYYRNFPTNSKLLCKEIVP